MGKTTPKITLVDVRQEVRAVHVLYELLRERSIENDPHVNISHRELPSFEEHARFFAHPPYYVWYLIHVENVDRGVTETYYAGYVSITFRNEIGIVLFRAYRGKGIGRAALEQVLRIHRPLPALTSQRPGRFVANINPQNERSLHLFQSLGFETVQWTLAHNPQQKEERA